MINIGFYFLIIYYLICLVFNYELFGLSQKCVYGNVSILLFSLPSILNFEYKINNLPMERKLFVD